MNSIKTELNNVAQSSGSRGGMNPETPVGGGGPKFTPQAKDIVILPI